jgi:hypothetical protein
MAPIQLPEGLPAIRGPMVFSPGVVIKLENTLESILLVVSGRSAAW